MVRPEDYINLRYSRPLIREIMLILNNFNAPLPSSEIMELCKTTHHDGKRYGIRRIETFLKKLVEDGDLALEIKATRGVGAPTKLYFVSEKFKKERDNYMSQPEYDRFIGIRAYIVPQKE